MQDFTITCLLIAYVACELNRITMNIKKIIERVQRDLDKNWPVDKADIQALINYITENQ